MTPQTGYDFIGELEGIYGDPTTVKALINTLTPASDGIDPYVVAPSIRWIQALAFETFDPGYTGQDTFELY